MRKHLIFLVLASLSVSACAGAQSKPINSKCFTGRGDLKCDLRPLPALWAEARQDAVQKVGVYEGIVEDGPHNVAN